MSMVVVGSVAYDGVETPHGKVDRMLGGACTYISLAASFFTQPKIVAVVGEDFAEEDTDLLLSRGIDLSGLERVPGKSFFWAGKYSPDMNDRETLATELNVFADFDPKLPESYKSSPYLLLGNIQPGLQKAVRSQMNGSLRLVGGDTMNYWIADFREQLLATIAEWDFLLINDGEARMLSGEYNLKKAAAKILKMGPSTLVIKRGEFGAILWREEGHFMAPGYLLEDVFDPTGAGDCFAGGFMGYLAGRGIDLKSGASHEEIRRAVIYGSVMGSFCCERFGVDRFRTLTRGEIDARFEEFRSFTSF
ncbi:MAG: sugar kinase [Acidobacteriota bacterium]|nr:sugar kinase [Acidobacteriota bacterium]